MVGLCGFLSAILLMPYVLFYRLTDREELLPLLRLNVADNFAVTKDQANGVRNNNNDNVPRVMRHCYGEDTSLLSPPFDVILAADVAYDPSLYSELMCSLVRLSHSHTLLLLSHELRKREERLFFDLLRQNFRVEVVEKRELDEMYQSDDIRIFRCWRKSA